MVAACSPQRYLANNRNALRPTAATLSPSSVQAVTDKVRSIPIARAGTAQVALTGSYTGTEEATYDVQIVDDGVANQLISSPVFAGAGSGTLSAITANTAAQTFTVQLNKAGSPTTAAKVDFEGVTLRARTPGAAGNAISIVVDRSPLVFTATNFSLLEDLVAGQGSDSNGIDGAGMDWDTAVIGSDDVIPAGAHRVAFGEDTSAIYLQYKRYANGKWLYHFVPALGSDIAKGSRVKFVTGGRDVTIDDGGSPAENYTGVVTLFDFLNDIRTQSVLLDVDGVVANDRTPTGQAARELVTRTDAYVGRSSGSGGAATGFVDTFAGANASTELVTAECFAVTQKDYPLAHVGNEFWKLKGSVSGDLGVIHTDQAYVHPDGKFGLRIPLRLPDGFGQRHGRFEVTGIQYAQRTVGEVEPPICPVALSLGPNAQDGSVTLVYTKRPSGDCVCDRMPIPNLDTACLGNVEPEGGPSMSYQADTVAVLKALYAWKHGAVKKMTAVASALEAALIAGSAATATSAWSPAFTPESLNTMIGLFESTAALIDPLSAGGSPDYRGDGMTEFAAAVSEFENDVDAIIGTTFGEITVTALEDIADGQAVRFFSDGDVWKATLWHANGPGFSGFAVGAMTVASPNTGRVRVRGLLTGLTAQTAGTIIFADDAVPGDWTATPPATPDMTAVAISATEAVVVTNVASLTLIDSAGIPTYGLVSDRYKARLETVLITAGISPLGKSSASILESGDGCWRDWGDPFYWTVVGDLGAYAPAFNNHPYYSSRKADDQGAYFSTHEFAFQINVRPECIAFLREGDTITMAIGDAGWPATYKVGDLLTLPVIAAQPLFLTGGADGNSIETWNVTGSLSGALANFIFDPSAPAPYDSGDSPPSLAFTLTPGGIPFAEGDRFTFAVVGGHYKWRKDGGAWSGSTAIPTAISAFDSGLSITFTPGASPAFVAGDTFSFVALQPWAVSNLQRPTPARWQWTGSTGTLDIDLGSVKSLDALAIAMHTLPVGATIELEGSVAPLGSPPDWTETPTRVDGVIAHPFTVERSARYLRLILTNATGGGIGWLWIGLAFSTTRAGSFQGSRAYNVQRANAGLFQGGQFLGKTQSGTLTWEPGALDENDASAIATMLDWIKSNSDEPIVFLPNVTRPDEALLARVLLDEVELHDEWDYQPTSGFDRLFSARLPLSGVWQ